MKYIDVVIDNNNDRTDFFYTYGCAFDTVAVGNRVFVPFALGNREKRAYVTAVRDRQEPEIKGLKYVTRIDEELSLDAASVAICLWMKKRYYCRYIEALRCFLPAGKRSQTGRKRRPEFSYIPEDRRLQLTDEQQDAMDRIAPWMTARRHRIFLVHGVTGSGKTELYLQVAAKALEAGRSAMALAPEISLTPQTIGRFVARFGARQVAVLHSGLSAGERYDEWMRIQSGEARIVIGARSAVFAPLRDLGAVVVDEEHEGAYKSDMTPKYDTIEVAIRRARQSGAVVLLGSATPSLVSAYRAEKRLYERIRLRERYNKNPLPQVRIVDMRDELRAGNRTIFSRALYQAVEENLRDGKQIILFLNRRGYSTFISCRNCGYAMRCTDCGISLIYHKTDAAALCHLCGARTAVPHVCPECGSKYLKFFGAGTEKVEETTRDLFPGATVERLDMDTARGKGSMDKMLNRFRKGKTQILIGTQLVAKGLDFSYVGLVGVVAADVTLNIPDFRAAERAFQIITQAAGRAGRGDDVGQVIIQSYKPDHFAIRCAAEHDYDSFYGTELLMRKTMEYPPFSDLVQITVSGRDAAAAGAKAETLAEQLRARACAARRDCILGPRPAQIFQVKELYRYRIYAKVRPGDREAFADFLQAQKAAEGAQRDTADKCSVAVDVNPYSYL